MLFLLQPSVESRFLKKAGGGFDTTESYSGGIIMEGLKRKGFLNGSEVDKSECRAGLRDYYLSTVI